MYIPKGSDLLYYDVNSLYPFVMKDNPMPIGKPKWFGNLCNWELDNLFGFVEAYVVCPEGIKRPLLPYRCNERGVLIFPTGKFFGVYYTEELKLAKSIGYKIEPLRGYLYEKGYGLFDNFVNTLFSARQLAKQQGRDGMSFVYKILMNSLYGRFGINPRSTVTEICSKGRMDELIQTSGFISGDKLSNNKFLCSYWSDQFSELDSDWIPRLGAVQIAAAVTAYARMHMYPFISREDSYYTDTDSVVLKKPLPPENICSETLGKFKLEYKVKEGIFLAPKSYCLITDRDKEILVHKGAAKHHVTSSWFKDQWLHMDKSLKVSVTNPFRIDRKRLLVRKQASEHLLAFPTSEKRVRVIKDGFWTDTEPVHINDMAGVSDRGRLVIGRLEDQLDGKKP